MEARELKEYRDRWKAVVAIEKEEQRQANLDFRWRQLNSLVGMAIALGLVFGAGPDEVQMVRRRWNLLKDLSNDRSGDELGDRS
jgi:hypothetical protein